MSFGQLCLKARIKLLYSTTYYLQTDGQNKRSNQTLKIALYFQIFYDTSYGRLNWPEILLKIQRRLNNNCSETTTKTFNEAAFSFTSIIELDLFKPLVDGVNPTKTCLNVTDSITFVKMNFKFHYNRKHQPIALTVRDYALIWLHKGYSIPFPLNQILDQQYVVPLQVTEKVGLFVYQLDIPKKW